jgi:Predicted metal-dependent enzyme
MSEKLFVADKLQRVLPAYPDDSLLRAAELMAQGGAGVLPIVEYGAPVGVLTESRLREAIQRGADWLEPVAPWMDENFLRLPIDMPLEEAVETLAYAEQPALGVDPWGRYVGVVTLAGLAARPISLPQIGMIGGMATPLGVYLTNGVASAGAGGLGLALTGALLFTLFLLANWLVIGGMWWAQERFGVPLYSYYNSPFAGQWFLLSDVMGLVLRSSIFVVFLLLMRLLPIAGTHAAEHMVVHAIERGEPLTLEVVRRMPRVHPRCGTNLVAGIALFLGLSKAFQFGAPDGDARDFALLMALLFTLLFWRSFGAFLQWVATTKPPTDRQLLQAIRVGEELLRKARPLSGATPPFGLRLLHSGLLQILLGAWGLMAILYLLESLLGITLIVQ